MRKRPDDADTAVDQAIPGQRGLADLPPGAPGARPIEIVLDRDTIGIGQVTAPRPYRALEIWTRNRLYVVDSTLTCVEVVDRESGERDLEHKTLGARLAGGQREYEKTLHISRPFPVPGTGAVFELPRVGKNAAPMSVTSKVERVVMHIRISSVVFQPQDAWDDVTSALLNPVFGARG
jgi:hypothetical protein